MHQPRLLSATTPQPNGWIHIVLNYIGPTTGEGIRIYYDGQIVASGANKLSWKFSAGDSKIVVGRRYTRTFYSSVEVD